MLDKISVKLYAKTHTVRECCEHFNQKYFTMYHYLRNNNFTFLKEDVHGKNNSNYKHGYKHTRIFHTWIDMRQRCNNVNNSAYKNYGGRGIKVCEEWDKDFTSFLTWSEANGYTDELTIDRINVDKDYCPENCRWVNRKQQSINKRNNRRITYKGQTKTLREWADILNMNYDKLRWRLDNWSDLDRIFNNFVEND